MTHLVHARWMATTAIMPRTAWLISHPSRNLQGYKARTQQERKRAHIEAQRRRAQYQAADMRNGRHDRAKAGAATGEERTAEHGDEEEDDEEGHVGDDRAERNDGDAQEALIASGPRQEG